MTIRQINEFELPELLRLYGHLHESGLPQPRAVEIDEIWSSIQQNPDLIHFGVYVSEAFFASYPQRDSQFDARLPTLRSY